MRKLLIAATLCASMSGPCLAQSSVTASTAIQTRILAQPLAGGLTEFAKLRHVELLYFTEEVRDLRTNGASGRLTEAQALSNLLSGTGLEYRFVGASAISIVRTSSRERGAGQTQRNVSPKREARTKSDRQGKPASDSATPQAKEGNSAGVSDPNHRHHKTKLAEVVITGSRIPTAAKYTAQEVQIYDGAAVEQSGQYSVADFLSTLPSVSVTKSVRTGYAMTVQLRGLPTGTTLVLLDGLRVNGSGDSSGAYFNVSEIPTAAVQRIEIDENGSSAIYGSDALAGVVNIILKKDFQGAAANARYGWANGIRNIQSSMALGKHWNSAGFSLIGSYEVNGALYNSARILTASNDYTKFGGPDDNLPTCFPGNVFSINREPLPGAPAGSLATYAAITGSTASGKPDFSQFTYGTLNECSSSKGSDNVPSIERGAVLANGYLQISPQVTLFSQLMYTRLNYVGIVGYKSLTGTATFQTFKVSAANPFNPFGETVGVTGSIPQAQGVQTIDTNFFRPVVGLKGSIASRWQWNISAWQSSDWSAVEVTDLDPNNAAIQAALNSANPETALNPFARGPIGSEQYIQSLFSPENTEEMGRDQSVQAWIRGPVVRLPAGNLQVVLGGEYDRSTFHTNVNYGSGILAASDEVATYRRSDHAVFGEARIPLVPNFGKREGSLVDLSVSGRRDEYSDFGGATTEQFGIEVKPVLGLLIRGTYGTAFAAPSLIELYSPQTMLSTATVVDPLTGARYPVTLTLGGNPTLRPETGRSHTGGVVYSVPMVRRLLLSATQWNIVESNAVQAFPDQTIVDYPALFPGRVVRNAGGQLIAVDDTNANFGSINVSGVDYDIEYIHRFKPGTASMSLDASQTYHYEQALVPTAPSVNAVSIAQSSGNWAPRWKGLALVGWGNGLIDAHFDGRYIGPYLDYESTRKIGNLWYMDANVRVLLGYWPELNDDRPLRHAYVEFGGTNLLNRSPQFSNYLFDSVGYDASQESIVGRALYVEIGTNW